jgi:phenylacetate-coenzyme A ligase PaaK-like adenylate-forming protein
MSRRGSAMLSIGLHRMLALPVTTPVPRMVAALNAFGPDCLHAYPSMAVLLADEKRAGRLRAAPAVITTSSELCSPEMADAIEDAFGVRPLDLYASTEGLWGAACGEGGGHHLFEDLTIAENVDEEGRPVADGERGARVLVTNLSNLVQPLIRFEVSDIVTIDPEPCPCGRTLRRMRSVEGRADAVLRLPGAAGGRVPVHPLQFGVITADRGVREFQVRQRGDGVRVLVVAREGEPPDALAERLRGRVGERLAALGVRDPRVEVEPCAALERPPAGKLQLVVPDETVAAPA